MSFLSLRDKGNVGFAGTWQCTLNDAKPKVSANVGYSILSVRNTLVDMNANQIPEINEK